MEKKEQKWLYIKNNSWCLLSVGHKTNRKRYFSNMQTWACGWSIASTYIYTAKPKSWAKPMAYCLPSAAAHSPNSSFAVRIKYFATIVLSTFSTRNNTKPQWGGGGGRKCMYIQRGTMMWKSLLCVLTSEIAVASPDAHAGEFTPLLQTSLLIYISFPHSFGQPLPEGSRFLRCRWII